MMVRKVRVIAGRLRLTIASYFCAGVVKFCPDASGFSSDVLGFTSALSSGCENGAVDGPVDGPVRFSFESMTAAAEVKEL